MNSPLKILTRSTDGRLKSILNDYFNDVMNMRNQGATYDYIAQEITKLSGETVTTPQVKMFYYRARKRLLTEEKITVNLEVASEDLTIAKPEKTPILKGENIQVIEAKKELQRITESSGISKRKTSVFAEEKANQRKEN